MYAVGVAAVTPGVLRQLEIAKFLRGQGVLGELLRVGGVGLVPGLLMYVSFSPLSISMKPMLMLVYVTA